MTQPHTLCLIQVIIGLGTLSAWSQASFELANWHTPVVNAPVYDAQGNPLEGAGYLVELWGAASSDSLAPALDVRTAERLVTPFRTDGYFVNTSGFLSIVDVPPHGYAWLQVRAWDASLGGTYEEVEALGLGGYGESLLFYAQGHNPYEDPPELPAPLIGLQSFSLRPIVPEPSAFACLALGAATLWALRRRR